MVAFAHFLVTMEFPAKRFSPGFERIEQVPDRSTKCHDGTFR
jgi:hypothetical protein